MKSRASAPGVTAPKKAALPTDGRKLRSHDSQQRIVAAMLDLIGNGLVSPSAEQVSARAGVGLRSVFRHFKDMESLHQAISHILASRLTEVAHQPFVAMDWQGQCLELVDRRAGIYEKMAPFLRAGQAHRHGSAVLQAGHVKFVAALRSILIDRLPSEARRDTKVIEAIDLLLSFDAWQRLRVDQRPSVPNAKVVLKQSLRAILGIRDGA